MVLGTWESARAPVEVTILHTTPHYTPHYTQTSDRITFSAVDWRITFIILRDCKVPCVTSFPVDSSYTGVLHFSEQYEQQQQQQQEEEEEKKEEAY
jgi:hypothetical protein